MISVFRKFAKSKIAGIFIFIIIIPFVFWGMGSMFNSGETNNIAKINKKSISTQDFMSYLNNSDISEKTIKENLDKNIIEELLSSLVSKNILDLEIENFNISISKITLLKKIKSNKIFLDEKNVFQRVKYEKFLLSNNLSAVMFEQQIKNMELKKNLFDLIGGGTVLPELLTKNIYEDENKTLEIEFFDLKNLYKKKEDFTDVEIEKFIKENENQLKKEYIDFEYVELNPKNLIGLDEFNKKFFDEIDKIENKISDGEDFITIVGELNLITKNVKEFTTTSVKREEEDIIYSMRNSSFDLIDNGNNFLLFNVINKYNRMPDLNNPQMKEEIKDLIYKKYKSSLVEKILTEIQDKKVDDIKFTEMGKDNIENVYVNSINDNKKFNINSLKILYSLPKNSFALVGDEKNQIYLVKKIDSKINKIDKNNDKYLIFFDEQITSKKNEILSVFDKFLTNKYQVELNEKSIDIVKNYFK